MNQPIFTNLQNCLAQLYPDEQSIRRVAADAGLDVARIILNSTTTNNWHSVLTEADKLTEVPGLLDVVEREYDSNHGFQKACADYRRLIGL